MTLYPDIKSSIPALEPLNEGIQFKTIKSRTEDVGQELRKQKWLYPKRVLRLKYAGLSTSDAQTLWQFYIARGGSYESFTVIYPYIRQYVEEYVGTGNGSQVIWNLPGKSSTSRSLYVGDVLQTEGVEWTFTQGGGADGEDKCEFGGAYAPSDGDRITFSFTGYLKVRCRFMEDNLDFETLLDRAVSSGIGLQGLLNSDYTEV